MTQTISKPKQENVPANTYFSQNEECLRNGSFYRFTGRKKERRFAHYILGDFHGFVNEVPDSFTKKTWAPKEGRKLLPPSMFS